MRRSPCRFRSAMAGVGSCRCSARRVDGRDGGAAEPDDSPEALAHALVQRVFELLHECRGILPELETSPARPESASAQAERLLYLALLASLEAGLVRTMEDAVSVLRRARAPLGPMGAEWLQAQDQLLDRLRREGGQ
jgi:hypothetical protein